MIRVARLGRTVAVKPSRPLQAQQLGERACSSTAAAGVAPLASAASNGTPPAPAAAAAAADKRAEKTTTAPALDASRIAAVTPRRSEWRPSEAHRASATSVARKEVKLQLCTTDSGQRSLENLTTCERSRLVHACPYCVSGVGVLETSLSLRKQWLRRASRC